MKSLLIAVLLLQLYAVGAQGISSSEIPIITGVGFLITNTDARSSGMGEISVVSNSFNDPVHLTSNPSLIAGRKKGIAGKINYTAWMREYTELLKDYGWGQRSYLLIDNELLVALNEKNSLSYSFRYFRWATVRFTNILGEDAGQYEPYEYVLQLRYARMFGKHFSLGVAPKFIFSSLVPDGQTVNGVDILSGKAFAADIGADYRTEIKLSEDMRLKINAGISILNFGTKIKYTDYSDELEYFIPTDLNAGVMGSVKKIWPGSDSSKSYVQVNLVYQMEKLMVPTPSSEDADSNGIYDFNEKSSMAGAFTSFSDAPGGAKEELHEIIHHLGTGVEFVYLQKFMCAANLGLFLENENKGDRKYFEWSVTAGAYGFYFDFSYLHPFRSDDFMKNTFKVAVGCSVFFAKGSRLRFYS